MITMIRFYDLLFYVIYIFYSTKEKGAVSTSAAIVGAVQAFNILTVVMFVTLLLNPKTNFSKIFGVVVVIIFQIIAYMRYINKHEFTTKVEEKWLQINKNRQSTFKIISFVYIVLSFCLFIALAIYWGSTRR